MNLNHDMASLIRAAIVRQTEAAEDREAEQLLADAVSADDDQGQHDVVEPDAPRMDDLIRRAAGIDVRRHRDRSGRRLPQVGEGID